MLELEIDHAEFDFAVFIGRFQPFHKGHAQVIEKARKLARHVVVCIGSAHEPRSSRNPWTWEERKAMIEASLKDNTELWGGLFDLRVHAMPILDSPYNEQEWIRRVQVAVADCAKQNWLRVNKEPTVALAGLSKDHSSYYLNLFPQWESFPAPAYCVAGQVVSSTDIRTAFFAAHAGRIAWDTEILAPGVNEILRTFYQTPECSRLAEENAAVWQFRQNWAHTPYPPVHTVVNAVVVQAGHILMTRRLTDPGKGLWALPGGFLQAEKTIEDAIIDRLKGELRLKVPEPVLRGKMRDRRVFDNPFRSTRGRVIAHVCSIVLDAVHDGLPRLSDARCRADVAWVPLGSLSVGSVFEDHFHIAREMIGGL